MEAYGDAMVMERAREMDAIAAIRKIKKTDAYMKGLENAIVSPFEASKEAITKPIQTLGNLPTGPSNWSAMSFRRSRTWARTAAARKTAVC